MTNEEEKRLKAIESRLSAVEEKLQKVINPFVDEPKETDPNSEA